MTPDIFKILQGPLCQYIAYSSIISPRHHHGISLTQLPNKSCIERWAPRWFQPAETQASQIWEMVNQMLIWSHAFEQKTAETSDFGTKIGKIMWATGKMQYNKTRSCEGRYRFWEFAVSESVYMVWCAMQWLLLVGLGLSLGVEVGWLFLCRKDVHLSE